MDTAASDNDGQQQSQEAEKGDNVYSWLNDPVAQAEYQAWLDELDRTRMEQDGQN